MTLKSIDEEDENLDPLKTKSHYTIPQIQPHCQILYNTFRTNIELTQICIRKDSFGGEVDFTLPPVGHERHSNTPVTCDYNSRLQNILLYLHSSLSLSHCPDIFKPSV